LQNNSTFGVVVNSEAYSCAMFQNLKKVVCFNFGDDILISTLITTVESNLRSS